MHRLARRLHTWLSALGIDLRGTVRSMKGIPAYRSDLRALKRQASGAASVFAFGDPRPCLDERCSDSGVARGHYFHQDLLVARRIHAQAPETHVDVGSRVDGFVAHVASFREIRVLDIRPLPDTVPNVSFMRADLMAPLPDALVGCCDSLSCLHALEHFGLGRYGDPVDYDGHLRGLDGLHALLRSGGTFYLSVPIGPQRIEFNAHRVFSVGYLLDILGERYRLARFSYIDDRGDLHEDVEMTDAEIARDFGCDYGCGVFELTKL